MAKIIWLCSRQPLSSSVGNTILEICKKIVPNNIVPMKPRIELHGNVAFGIMNPTNTLSINGNSVLMGMIIDETSVWHIPCKDYPDGSYCLFRDGEEYCEVISDAVASRTIWYYFNDDIFIASTSQRAIIMFIGNFVFDKRVIPWILSTGTLGPTLSWDSRLNRIPPDSSLILDKANWSLTIKSNPIIFKESKDSDKHHKEKLTERLNSVFGSIGLNISDWVLPLSGGYDSRGILSSLSTRVPAKDLRTVTWGLKSSLEDKKNDAFIAEKLARQLNVAHQYFLTNLSEEPIEEVIDRFIENGEGRIDHISGYLDGFKIWKTLYESKVQGIIRGDEGFGWSKVSSRLSVRLSVGLGLCSDYESLKDYRKWGLPEQELPEPLEQLDKESLEQWRDRLYHAYRLPTFMAALSDLKLGYVELVNPLLTKKILEYVRQLPDHLRTEKSLFKRIVVAISPEVEFATRAANASISNFLKQSEVVDLLRRHLSSNSARELFPETFLINIQRKLATYKNSQSLNRSHPSVFKSLASKLLPTVFKNTLKRKLPQKLTIDHNVLAFRIYIIVRMKQILNDSGVKANNA